MEISSLIKTHYEKNAASQLHITQPTLSRQLAMLEEELGTTLFHRNGHGVTQKEIAAIITHAAFYAGWPKGWAVFNIAKEVWDISEGDLPYEDDEQYGKLN